MISMMENEVVGHAMPVIRGKYGQSRADKLVNRLVSVNRISELEDEEQEMIRYGITHTSYGGKPEQESVAKTFSQCVKQSNIQAQTFSQVVQKYNPYHDKRGRFSSKNSFATRTFRAKDVERWPEPVDQGSSLAKHIDPKTGKITPERMAFYNKIVSDYIRDIERPEGSPSVDFMGGGGGSGKGTAIRQGVVKVPEEGKAVTVDPDDIKLKFPEFGEIASSTDTEYAKRAAAHVHEESSIVSRMLARAATEKGINIVMDGTAKDPGKIGKQVAEAKANGYQVRAHYISCPTEIAVADNAKRFENNNNPRERRYVPESSIRAAHRDVSANWDRLHPLFDTVEVVQNDRSSPVRRIAYKENGKMVVTDKAAYQAFIDKGKELQPHK